MLITEILGSVAALLGKGLDMFGAEDKAKAQLLLKQIDNLQAQNIAQANINAQEAKHDSIFVAGWRPCIGWVCAIAIAFTFIVRPFIFPFLYEYYPSLALLPEVNEHLFELVLGMLGLAGLRTVEKHIKR